MKIPNIYLPLTKLKGYVTSNVDSRFGIYYFYYKIKIKGNCIRLFLYVFQNETFSGVEYILDKPERKEERISRYLEPYRQTASEVVYHRDRLKRILG